MKALESAGAETIKEELLTLVNKTLVEALCPLYVVKKDRQFRDFF